MSNLSNFSLKNAADNLEYDSIYITIEVIVGILAVTVNLLVVLVFAASPAVRTIKNYYKISLAVADILVGFIGVPCAITTSIGKPENFHACLFTNSLLLLLCKGSIFSLVTISIDRFWAIQWPLSYPQNMTHSISLCIISVSWVLALLVGLLPLLGWNKGRPQIPSCYFMEIMDMGYLARVYFGAILMPVLFMVVAYGIIFKAIKRQVSITSKLLVPANSPSSGNAQSGHEKLKAAWILSVMILLFSVSWIPLNTFNTVKYFCTTCSLPSHAIKFLVILTHCNSVWNPVIYTWGMKDFRRALLLIWSRL